MPLSPKDHFLRSLNRCKKNVDFIESFYERFLASSDEIAEKFRYTDFERQHSMLVHSLELAAHAVEGDPKALHILNDQAFRHSRENLDIRPGLYPIWLNAIISTAAEFDPLWDETVGESWQIVLEHVIHHMAAKY